MWSGSGPAWLTWESHLRSGTARHSPAQPSTSTAWHSLAQSGTARHCPAQPGTVWHSLAQSGTARHCPAQSGTICHSPALPSTAWHSLAQSGTVWHSLAQPGTVRHRPDVLFTHFTPSSQRREALEATARDLHLAVSAVAWGGGGGGGGVWRANPLFFRPFSMVGSHVSVDGSVFTSSVHCSAVTG